jgi:hypothetical protein
MRRPETLYTYWGLRNVTFYCLGLINAPGFLAPNYKTQITNKFQIPIFNDQNILGRPS